MALNLLAQQYATCLTAFSGQGSLGTTRLSYTLSVMVDHFNIFCELLVISQMPFDLQLINSLSTITIFVYFSFLVILVTIC
jgi:hypothetical protein